MRSRSPLRRPKYAPSEVTQEWIGHIVFHPAVEAKLRTKHRVTPGQVREAVAYGAADSLTWHTHPVYGERLIATGSDQQGPMIVYLRPIDRTDGTWECLTARRWDD